MVGIGLQPVRQCSQRHAHDLFEALGEFPSHHNLAFGLQRLKQFRRQRLDAMRCLEEHEGLPAGRQRLQPFLTQAGTGGQEPLEEIAPTGQARGAEQRGGGAGPGDRHDGDAGGVRCGYQQGAGVTDARGAGISDQRYRFAAPDAIQHAFGLAFLVVGVQRQAARVADAQRLQQRSAAAGVLGGNPCSSPQRPCGARADIFEVSDGRGHYI